MRGAFGDELDDLLRAIGETAQERAAQYGLKCAVRYEDAFPDTFNHPACAEKVRRAARELGIPSRFAPARISAGTRRRSPAPSSTSAAETALRFIRIPSIFRTR